MGRLNAEFSFPAASASLRHRLWPFCGPAAIVPVMPAATALVPTAQGGRYLQQLCKHWAHHLAVDFTPERGRVVFPRDLRGAAWPGEAVLELAAEPGGLACRLSASHPDQLTALKDVVARHLDRFAFARRRWPSTGATPRKRTAAFPQKCKKVPGKPGFTIAFRLFALIPLAAAGVITRSSWGGSFRGL